MFSLFLLPQIHTPLKTSLGPPGEIGNSYYFITQISLVSIASTSQFLDLGLHNQNAINDILKTVHSRLPPSAVAQISAFIFNDFKVSSSGFISFTVKAPVLFSPRSLEVEGKHLTMEPLSQPGQTPEPGLFSSSFTDKNASQGHSLLEWNHISNTRQSLRIVLIKECKNSSSLHYSSGKVKHLWNMEATQRSSKDTESNSKL